MSAHVRERLSAYLDGELPADERPAIDAHLRVCASCARHLEDLAAVDDLARALPLEAPAGYFESLPARVRFKLTPRQRRAFVLPTWSWAAAAALLLAVIVPRVLDRRPSPAAVATREALETPAPPPPAAPPPKSAAAGVPPAEPRLGEAQTSRDDRRARNEAAFAEPPATPPARPAPPPMEQEKAQRSEPGAMAPGKAEDEAPRAQAAAPAPAREGQLAAKSAPYAVAPPEEPVVEGAAAQQLPETYAEEKDAAEAVTSSAELEKRSAPARASGRAALADEGARRKLSRSARYRSLLVLSPADATEARRAREEWREFVALHPPAPEADEARVRIVEMGVKAWRFSNDPADLALLRQDAEAYLRRDDAAQGSRVRRLLDTTGN